MQSDEIKMQIFPPLRKSTVQVMILYLLIYWWLYDMNRKNQYKLDLKPNYYFK